MLTAGCSLKMCSYCMLTAGCSLKMCSYCMLTCAIALPSCCIRLVTPECFSCSHMQCCENLSFSNAACMFFTSGPCHAVCQKKEGKKTDCMLNGTTPVNTVISSTCEWNYTSEYSCEWNYTNEYSYIFHL